MPRSSSSKNGRLRVSSGHKHIIRKTVKKASSSRSLPLVDEKSREMLIRRIKSFGSFPLLHDIQDPTLVEIDEKTALQYFCDQEVGITEALERGGKIRFFETTEMVLYLSDNGYAGRTMKGDN